MEYGAVLVWWAASLALAVAGLPIAAAVLAWLPDRGAGLALPTALVALAVPAYWVGHVAFGPAAVAAGIAALAVGAAVTAWRGPGVRLDRFLEASAVFTVGFLLVVAIRAVDPSVVPLGGEKFLDFGLLNALLRTDVLPPEDFWFAGEPVQYYYGGHLIASLLAVLTDTAARYAYNLALAVFYGALVAAAYGVAGSVAAARGGPYRLAGALGALFVGFASNLVAPLQALLWALPAGPARAVAGAVAGRSAISADGLLILREPARTPFYWASSRVIDGTINEFPLFAFLNGDLHAHMMSTPFLLLVVAVAFAYYRTRPEAVTRRRLLVYGAVPPVAGLLAVVNTWSFPSAVGVTLLAVLFAPANPATLLPTSVGARLPHRGPRGELARIGAATAAALGVAALGVVWALPFFVGPATGASGRSIGLFPARSGLVEFLLVHGWLVGVFAAWVAPRVLESVERPAVTGVLALVILAFGLLADAAAVAVVAPLLTAAWLLAREDPRLGFETVLFVAGAGLVLLVEFVYVREQAGPGRMNTVFKTYMQVWVIWATGAGAALARLCPPAARVASGDGRERVAGALVAVLLLSVSIYGAVSLSSHFEGAGEPTLDATTWARETHPEEWEAIRFLDRRSGQPNIATAPGCWCNPVVSTRPYRWVNAPSSFTGIPTLAGWSHETGYRGREVYRSRVEDVRTLYTGTWAQRVELLRAYEVEYVYVGPNERDLYGAGADAFAGHDGISVAFRNDAVTVYAVDHPALSAGG